MAVMAMALPAVAAKPAAAPAKPAPAKPAGVPARPAPADYPAGIRTGIARMAADGSGIAPVYNSPPERREVHVVVFADTAGHPLSFSPTGAECTGACLQKWRLAIAEPGSKGLGDWTLVGQGPGSLQWAFRGKPLYVRASGDLLIDQPYTFPDYDPSDPWTTIGIPLQSSAADGMQLALVEPQNWIEMPFTMSAAESRLAPGFVLVAGVTSMNPLGTPLYTFSGTVAQEKKLPALFKPEYAAALDLPVGDFKIRTRPDGTRQWAYKGAALFRCECDISTGDLNGKGAAPGLAPAVLVHYFLPAQVAIKKDRLAIGYIVEASTGKTLYYRDRLIDDYTPDHARPVDGTMSPTVGASLAMKHCDAECEKEWIPFLAPKDAPFQGYWSYYVRADGKHQWAYKGSALYTHATERPGSLDGNETYTIRFADGFGGKAAPPEFGLGLAWRAVVP
jgi:predicted lipoprotein with Yx(FWY)xxD motif